LSKKVHFIGIGGIGLSALARFLKRSGYEISGSDMSETKITKALRKEGIKVSVPHSENSITDQDIVIYSAAIKDTNIELKTAKKKGLKIFSRKEALLWILKDKKVYSVAGAHGKSTTSAMLASLIHSSMIIGAESKQFDTNMVYKNTEAIVFEADESDGSFLNSNPEVAVVINAEPEHMEYYGYDLKRFYAAYESFLKKAKIRVINAEDEFLSTLDMEAIRLYPSRDIKNIKTFIKDNEPYTSFELKNFGVFEVCGIGEHIALDASMAILAALIEMDTKKVRENLKNYKGIKKRFDIITKNEEFIIIDDYGHHPTEIEATIKSAKRYAALMGLKKITAIWQPHKYSRTTHNLKKFVECFCGIDTLVILPVWGAGEAKREIDFKNEFKRYSPVFADKIKREKDKLSLLCCEKSFDKLENGLVIGFGAGDITYQLRG
jgi:UDP-N-acetylmuramate--alanine ligase